MNQQWNLKPESFKVSKSVLIIIYSQINLKVIEHIMN